MKWDNVVNEVDNYIWFVMAAAAYIAGKLLNVPELYALAGACLVKVKQNGKPKENG